MELTPVLKSCCPVTVTDIDDADVLGTRLTAIAAQTLAYLRHRGVGRQGVQQLRDVDRLHTIAVAADGVESKIKAQVFE